jgi:hypothetical protein
MTMEETMGTNSVNDPRSNTMSPGKRPSSLRPGILGAIEMTMPIAATVKPTTTRTRPRCSKPDIRPLPYSLFLNPLIDTGGDAKDHHEQAGEEHDDDNQCDDRNSALDQRR